MLKGRKEGNVLFNDALNTFYLRLNGVTHMVKDHSDLPPVINKWFKIKHFLSVRRKEKMFCLMTHSIHFYLRLYGVTHMVKDHSDSDREKTHCCHLGYSFRLAARVLLYASSHREDNTYHCLCYTRYGTLAGTRNSSMGPP